MVTTICYALNKQTNMAIKLSFGNPHLLNFTSWTINSLKAMLEIRNRRVIYEEDFKFENWQPQIFFFFFNF